MKISILGAGNVGGALGRAWAKRGHQITFGVPRPNDPKVQSLVAALGPAASARDVAGAAAAGEVVVLATPWLATQEAIRLAGAHLNGKLVIDCTNPLKPDLSGLTVGLDDSGGEQVARWARGASVFKAMNQTGADNMAECSFPGGKPVMLVCGDDEARKPVVVGLVAELGFEALDAGGLAAARMLEPYGLLWIHLAIARKLGTRFAFQLARR
jgi:hypothetical protein